MPPLFFANIRAPRGRALLNAALSNLRFESSSEVLRSLTACLLGWYLLRSNCGFIYSSRGERPDRMGESGRERQFPQLREPERVRARDVGPRLPRICGGSGGLRDDGFHFHGNDGQCGVAAEGTWPRSSSHCSLWESQPGAPLWTGPRSDI